jgi:hypothetical protein
MSSISKTPFEADVEKMLVAHADIWQIVPGFVRNFPIQSMSPAVQQHIKYVTNVCTICQRHVYADS